MIGYLKSMRICLGIRCRLLKIIEIRGNNPHISLKKFSPIVGLANNFPDFAMQLLNFLEFQHNKHCFLLDFFSLAYNIFQVAT